MTENAGRLEVEVVASLSGFAEKLRAGVERAAEGVTARVGIELDASGLRERLEAAVEAAAAGVTAKIRVDLDAKSARAQLEALGQEVRARVVGDSTLVRDTEVATEEAQAAADAQPVKVKVETDDRGSFLSRLRDLLHRGRTEAAKTPLTETVVADVQADQPSLVARLRLALSQAVAVAGRVIHVPIRGDSSLTRDTVDAREQAQLFADAEPVEVKVKSKVEPAFFQKIFAAIGIAQKDAEGNAIKPGFSTKGLESFTSKTLLYGGLASLLQPALALITQTGAGLLSIVGSAGQALGVLGGFPAVLGAVATGFLGFKNAFGGFSTAVGTIIKQQQLVASGRKLTKAEIAQEKQALQQLSPEAQKAARAFVDVYNQWKPIKKSIQDATFRKFTADIRPLAASLFPLLADKLHVTGEELGTLIHRGAEWAKSPMFRSDLGRIMDGGNKSVTAFGKVLLNLGHAFVDLAVAAQPFLSRLDRGAVSFSKWVADWASAARSTGTFAKMLGQAQDKASTLGRIVRSLWTGFAGIFRAAMPSGNRLLDSIEQRLAVWSRLMNSPAEQGRLRSFFNESEQTLRAITGIFGAMGRAIMEMSRNADLRPMLDDIRYKLGPAVHDFFDNLGRNVGPKVIDFISTFAQLLSQLSAAGGPVAHLISLLTGVVKALNWMVDHVPLLRPLLSTLFGAALTAGAAAFLLKISGVGKALSLVYKTLTLIKATGGIRAAMTAAASGQAGAILAQRAAAGTAAAEEGLAASAAAGLARKAKFGKALGLAGLGLTAGTIIDSSTHGSKLGSTLGGAASGAGIGAGIGALGLEVPVVGEITTALGAAIGGVVGGIAGFFHGGGNSGKPNLGSMNQAQLRQFAASSDANYAAVQAYMTKQAPVYKTPDGIDARAAQNSPHGLVATQVSGNIDRYKAAAAALELAGADRQAAAAQQALDAQLTKAEQHALSAGASYDQFRSSLNSLRQSTVGESKSLKGYTDAAIGNRNAIRGTVAAMFDHINAMRQAGKPASVVREALLKMEKQLLKTADATYKNKGAVKDFLAQLGVLPGQINHVLSPLAGYGLKAGMDLGRGLINGINAMTGPVTVAAKIQAAQTVKNYRLAFAQNSPSKKLHDVGVGVGEGLRNGINSMVSHTNRAARRMANGVLTRMRASDMGAAFGGGSPASAHIGRMRSAASSATAKTIGQTALVGGDLVLQTQATSGRDAISGAMFELRRISYGGVYATP